jgi:hypothetical protein
LPLFQTDFVLYVVEKALFMEPLKDVGAKGVGYQAQTTMVAA